MLALMLIFAAARAEPTPTEAWLHLEIGEDGPVVGRVRYAVRLDAPTTELRLDAGPRVRVNRAVVQTGDGGAVPLTMGVQRGVVVLRPRVALVPGSISITLEFSAQVGADDHFGFFAVASNSSRFVYSHFEPNHARDAFPCFDAPRFKFPWTVEVEAPSTFLVVTNSTESSVVRSRRTNTWEFERSPPMPSYLVAIAAGPFVVSTVRNVGRGDLNVRVLGPSPSVVQPYLHTVWEAMDWTEAWMDAPLPWPKLDIVIIEAETWFGAMEHPGLILARSVADLEWAGEVLRHELLHFWFGDRVTPRVWSDVWLNEGPAYWAASAAPGSQPPAWLWDSGLGWGVPGPIHAEPTRHGAAELSPRQQWGAGALLATLDTWRTLEWSPTPSLQTVLRDYAAARMDGHADTASFVAALAAAWPDLPVEAALLGLLDEPATPTVTLDWACEAEQATVFLTQSRAPGRSNLPPLPVFFRAEGAPTQVVLLGDSLGVPLETCPAWVLGNATGAGFYRLNYEGGALAALQTPAAGQALTEHERYALYADP